jgi:hypothetical protein
MSTWKIPNGEQKNVDGKEVKTKGCYTTGKKSSFEYIKYLFGPKDDHDVIEPEIRTKWSKSNFFFDPMPVYGTETFNKDLLKFSNDAADKLIENQNKYSSINPRRSNKRNVDFHFQEIILSNVHEEFNGLNQSDLDEWAERMYEQGLHMIKQLTGQKVIINDFIMKPHFKHDPKRPGKLLPDMHILIGNYDYKGKPLDLGPDCGIMKIARIHQEMENLPKFNYLLKTRTEAWERKGALIPAEKVKSVTDLIDQIIEANRNKPTIMHNAFKAAGIHLEPFSKGTGVQYVEVKYKGETFRSDIPAFSKDTLSELRIYFGQKGFEENYPKIDGAEFGTFYHLHTQLNQIFKKYEGKSLIELTTALAEKAVVATPFVKKDGTITGFTFTLSNKDNAKTVIDLKGGWLHFDHTKYKYNSRTVAKIVEQAKHLKNEKYIAMESHNQIIINGETYKVDEFGNMVKVVKSYTQKKKDFVEWMKWIKADDETLPEFRDRLVFSRNNKMTFLTSAKFKDGDNIVYSKHNDRPMFEMKDNGFVSIYQNNPSSIKSALQAYMAMNQLSEDDKKAGFKLAIKLTSESEEFKNKMWLEAKLLGFVVSDFTPSPEIQAQLDKKLNDKLDRNREQNRRSLERYANMTAEERQGMRLNLRYNTALENDVDRRAMALAYVDAFKMGLDTGRVLNPPKLHQDNRRRCYENDLIKHQRLMLKAIKAEAPEMYDDFVKQLKKDAPTTVIIEDVPEVLTPEAKAQLDIKLQKLK